MTDVVIVGAGPIGLAHAWAIKKLNPKLRIVIHEKYEVYQRKHTLIMRHEHLESLMRATDTENHPLLKKLLERLKNDPHIRTSELEETFKALALETKDGEEPSIIKLGEIKEANIREQIVDAYPTAKLIIGADGTHSVVSKVLFGADNQIKQEFDYVLQLRYEIKGEVKAISIETIPFYQNMARLGIIASEYVGGFADGKTPVTMQMMISKDVFDILHKHATSKNPIKFEEFNTLDILPDDVRSFVSRYLEHKLAKCHEHRQLIDGSSIRVSVNEAPATYAQHVNTRLERTDDSCVDIQLVGDAQLGLSYFKGLNAGMEAAAVFISNLTNAIKNNFSDAQETQAGLAAYQSWFTDYAPKKVNEVAQYSTLVIRTPMKIMKAVQSIKNASALEALDKSPEALIRDYLQLQQAPAHEVRNQLHLKKFPHRSYDPVKLGQLAYVPITHNVKKIVKLFLDYVRPYKSVAQMKQDFRQPLVGSLDILSGIAKLFIGLVNPTHPERFVDSLFTLLRGAIEVVTFPLAWTIKPITRGIVTGMYYTIWGAKKIEDNAGMQKLAKRGIHSINKFEHDLKNVIPSAQTTYDMLAICHDMHRKFHKGVQRQQKSNIEQEEELLYSTIAKEPIVQPGITKRYFSLFFRRNEPVRNDDHKEHVATANNTGTGTSLM